MTTNHKGMTQAVIAKNRARRYWSNGGNRCDRCNRSDKAAGSGRAGGYDVSREVEQLDRKCGE